jgi:hypothetical protein
MSRNKIWKETPPGIEQDELNRMFKENQVTLSSTPSEVHSKSDLFLAYPLRTFTVHFNSTKRRFGLNCKYLFIYLVVC